MEIILMERVEHLGQMGEVVKVKPGFARNFLLPRGKAVRATAENRKRFEAQRAQLEAGNLERRSEAEAVAVKLEGLCITLIRQAGEAGQLYGSVSARDIADGVTAAGFTIERQQVRLNLPIKALGLHPVAVGLHPEVTASITVNVARSPDEAKLQLRTGGAVGRGEDRFAEPVVEQDVAQDFESDVEAALEAASSETAEPHGDETT